MMVLPEASRFVLIEAALRALAECFTDQAGLVGGFAFDHGIIARLRRGASLIDVWSVLYDRLTTEQAVLLLPADDAARALGAWALVLRGMALMAPDPHATGRSPGAALAAAGVGEARITRLAEAEGDAFDEIFLSTCRHLRVEGLGVDWVRFGRLALERRHAPGVPPTDIASRLVSDFVQARRNEPTHSVSAA